MTYTLYAGDRAYSSWSFRGFLLLEPFGLPFRTRIAEMWTPEFEALKREIAPGLTVPVIAAEDLPAPVWDSMAIAETLHERHPDAGIWPTDAAARAAGRSLAAEMHSGFMALRTHCPMNLRRRYHGFEVTEEVRADVARAISLWSWAFDRFGGPWLCGAGFSAADAFYAPLASRLATYRLTEDPTALAYVDAIHRLPSFRRWRAMAMASPRLVAKYELDLPSDPPFGEPPLPARAVTGATPVNAACPYSGKPVAADSLAEIDGVAIGFCNPFCRDKTVADALAWPGAAEILDKARRGA